ncbi:hypothetical protein [Variovorax beijingensis]|uniref:hypothetical protein n=1 Tax=Variovorax beijingensis TaxID=2496117 RepID=UPI003F699003
MSSSDSGSPTAARMLISLQRLAGGGLFGAGAFSASSGCGTATATACGFGLALGFEAGAGGGFGCTGLATGAGSRGPAAERQGVRHGFVSAAAGKAPPHSAITIAIGAMAENGEDRGW